MVLNGTSGNLWKIEGNLRDLCTDLTSDQNCTVFAVFDMCKDVKSKYQGILSANQDKKTAGKAKVGGEHRGEKDSDDEETGTQLFFLEGAESEGVVAADSIMARDLLDTFDRTAQANGGTITLPRDLSLWPFGNLKSALGATQFKIEWVSFFSTTFYLSS